MNPHRLVPIHLLFFLLVSVSSAPVTQLPSTMDSTDNDAATISSLTTGQTITDPTTTTVTSIPVSLPKSNLVEHHLKKSVPVDLYNPCHMGEEEAWMHETDQHEEEHQNGEYEIVSESIAFAEELAETLELFPKQTTQQTSNTSHTSNTPKVTLTQRNRAKVGLDLLQDMAIKVNSLQGIVTDMVRKHLIQECYTLDLPDIIHMQIAKDKFTNTHLVDTLQHIYKTLVNQTAHLYFIYDQQTKSTKHHTGCGRTGLGYDSSKFLLGDYFHKRTHARKVANDFFVVGSNLRGLMCQFQQAFVLFKKPVETKNIVKEVLNHRFHLSPSCSRMQIIDCQLMRNSVRIFSDISEFLRKHSHRLFSELLQKQIPQTTQL